MTAGITSGPNGEPRVVGIVYADSRPANSKFVPAIRKAVLLGYDKGRRVIYIYIYVVQDLYILIKIYR